ELRVVHREAEVPVELELDRLVLRRAGGVEQPRVRGGRAAPLAAGALAVGPARRRRRALLELADLEEVVDVAADLVGRGHDVVRGLRVLLARLERDLLD